MIKSISLGVLLLLCQAAVAQPRVAPAARTSFRINA